MRSIDKQVRQHQELLKIQTNIIDIKTQKLTIIYALPNSVKVINAHEA